MTDDFLTEGLRDDRYLKAIQLVEQFEDEIEATLREVGQRMVDQHPDLFATNPTGSENSGKGSSSTLAYTRINYSMVGGNAPETDQPQVLNVHLYWVNPTEYNRTGIDGALRAFGYKIKYAPEAIDDRVAEQTKDWPLLTSGNPFDPNVTFYRHVRSAAEIEETAETLVKHFAEFGDAYAIN